MARERDRYASSDDSSMREPAVGGLHFRLCEVRLEVPVREVRTVTVGGLFFLRLPIVTGYYGLVYLSRRLRGLKRHEAWWRGGLRRLL